eukprot:10756591-Alexandrium_andersonii.AAC.1
MHSHSQVEAPLIGLSGEVEQLPEALAEAFCAPAGSQDGWHWADEDDPPAAVASSPAPSQPP